MHTHHRVIVGLCFIWIGGAGFGFIIGHTTTTLQWQEDAVKAHKAEYYLDSNNIRQWHWLP